MSPAAVLAYWVVDLDPYVFRISGDFGVRWYGMAYIAGFAVAYWLFFRYARAGRSKLPVNQIGDLMFAVVIGVMVGGRLGSYLLYDGWQGFLADPLGILRIWEGGMASHGGFIGVVLALVWFARRKRIPFLHLGDLVVSAAPAGLLFGRVANFVNGELWGRISVVPWAMIFPRSAPPGTPVELISPRHPSQLYEALLEGALLLAIMQWRFWRTDVVGTRPGRLSGEFLLAYALVRVFCETFREPDAGLILGLSRGTFYSIFLAAAGVFLIARAGNRKRSEAG